VGINIVRKLPSPDEVKTLYPLSEELKKTVEKRGEELKNIFLGKSDKLILIIGPCSADNEDSVIDYILRLRKVQEKVRDNIFIIPRLYSNKPRTTADGYMGMLHQPDPVEKPDMYKGLIATRQLHLRVLSQTGFSCADEMLYPENDSYLNDLLCYVAVGARSVENQQHRLTSSGLDIPVGMKNPTNGDLTVMMNSVNFAQHKHTFIYRGYEVNTDGNPYAHAILRGYVNKNKEPVPNYTFSDLSYLSKVYEKSGLKNPAVIIDTNHSNSGKKYLEQIRIAKDVLTFCKESKEINKLIKGFMIESYIEDGAQKIGEGIYGKSITDPCLGWEKTECLILDIAEIRG